MKRQEGFTQEREGKITHHRAFQVGVWRGSHVSRRDVGIIYAALPFVVERRKHAPEDLNMQKLFCDIASKCSQMMGGPWAFLAALALVVGWAASGPLFHYSDSWELIINTATTIITFLMVFLIQNTQNRDAKAIHLKLDELIFALTTANNAMLNIETLSSEELEVLEEKYRKLASKAAEEKKKAPKQRKKGAPVAHP
jgi:low affinity Fe/Cu permease